MRIHEFRSLVNIYKLLLVLIHLILIVQLSSDPEGKQNHLAIILMFFPFQ